MQGVRSLPPPAGSNHISSTCTHKPKKPPSIITQSKCNGHLSILYLKRSLKAKASELGVLDQNILSDRYRHGIISCIRPGTSAHIRTHIRLWLFAHLHCSIITCPQTQLQPPRKYPHKEPILGLDLVYAIIQSAKKGRFLESLLQRHREYGRTFRTTSFGKTIINTVEPKVLSAVFATASDNFGVAPIREPPAKPLVGRGIFTTDGPEWAHSRGLIRPCFSRAQVADLTLLKLHVDHLLELIPRDGSTIDLQALFCRLVSP